jgi:[acyl-carrier-protein] S-malonyltransferase
MQQASNKNRTGMVAVVGLDESGVQHLCNVASEKSGQPISIGNFLSKGNYALSGHIDACKVVKDIGKSLGARLIVPLAVSGAFHSAYMNSAVPLLRTELDNVRLQPPRVTVLSNVEGRPYKNIEDIRNCLLRQVVEPVQWSKTISAMVESATLEKCYEIGPGTVCRGTVKSMRKDAVVENIS